MTETSAHECQDLSALRCEQIMLENEKLKIDLAALRRGSPWYRQPVEMVPIVTALLAVIGFWWGVVQYKEEQNKNREAKQAEARREELESERQVMQPWLETQRSTYAKALSAAAEVATASDAVKRQRAIDEFWRLYQGEMIPVETKRVSGAMILFGRCVDKSDPCDREEMNRRSRALGTAIARSMAETAKMTYADYVKNRFEYSMQQVN